MRSPRPLTVISLGGGVQSSVMALMASDGAFDRVPDCTIFADAHWEPPSVYDHIEWLKTRLRFPLYVVDNGRSLREDVKALTNHSGSTRYVDIPVFLKGRDGETDGIGRRQCTDSYKIRPIRRRIRELLGLRKGRRVPANTAVELWLGISTDEAIRMKTSRDRWIENRCPLIEAGMSRRTVTAFFDDSGGPDPNSSRSFCFGAVVLSASLVRECSASWTEVIGKHFDVDGDQLGYYNCEVKSSDLYDLRRKLRQGPGLRESQKVLFAHGLNSVGRVDGLIEDIWEFLAEPSVPMKYLAACVEKDSAWRKLRRDRFARWRSMAERPQG